MTQANFHASERHSVIDGVIESALTGAIIVLAGILALAQFAAVVVA